MALLQFNDGRRELVSREVGENVWACLNGDIEPNDDQEEFLSRVEKVWLNWRYAPDSYIAKNTEEVLYSHLRSVWMVNKQGRLTGPEAGDSEAWAFATKWGLIYQGVVTPKAKEMELNL